MAAEPARLPRPADRQELRPPKHLAADGRRLWRRVTAEYHVDEGWAVEILRLACEAVDRGEAARQGIATDGMTVEGRFGPKLNPLVQVERDSALRAARLLRELGVSLETPDVRPPSRWRS